MPEAQNQNLLHRRKANLPLVFFLSMALLVPCFWHRHIEAGDLGSHVYNAWLAQLIGEGQAPGLFLVRQYDNVLFDLLLVHLAKLFGFALAEKVACSFSSGACSSSPVQPPAAGPGCWRPPSPC